MNKIRKITRAPQRSIQGERNGAVLKISEGVSHQKRIDKLAQPKSRRHLDKEPLYSLADRALFATTSSRIKELAKPKFIAHKPKKDPFKISQKALHYFPSKRILFLAKPKRDYSIKPKTSFMRFWNEITNISGSTKNRHR